MAARKQLESAATGPLAGVRVIDLTSVVNGAYATQILADQGADVIKIEDPGGHRGGGDMTRWGSGMPPGTAPGMGPLFVSINRNKRSVVLDLRADEGRETLRRLIATADVFAASVRYDGLKRLGLGYEDVAAIKPDIVYMHTGGYGSDGPYAGEPAYDDLIQAASGLTDIFRIADGNPAPRFIPTVVADKVSGLFVAQAITAALFHRSQTGEGQFVEVPMFECLTSFTLVEHINGHVFAPPTAQWGYPRVANPSRKPFATSDGYIALLPYTDKQWRQFFTVAGWDDTVARDPRFATDAARFDNIAALYALLETVTPLRSTAEWLALLRPLSIPVVKVNRLDDLETDPHLVAVGLFEEYTHPALGGYIQVRPPVRFDKTPSNIRRHPPLLGEHNDELFDVISPISDAAPHIAQR